jgi:oligoribonuclease (3'-5' exoribonuclease)
MKLAIVDTETTGLDPNVHAVWEVCVITVDVDGPVWRIKADTRQVRLHEKDIAVADGKSLAINNFHRRYDVGNIADDATYVAAWVQEATAGRVLVGSNPSFDAAFLTRLLLTNGVLPAWHYRTVCVSTMAAGYLSALGHEVPVPWSSGALTDLLGVERPEDEMHTALGDALWAMGVFKRLIEARPGVARTSLTEPVAQMARSYADDGWTLGDFADLLSGTDPA